MNRFAYRTTGLAIKTLSNLVRARINLHGSENIPDGARIFVINHFTRIETVLMPYYINRLIHVPVWSLADAELFIGAFGGFLDSVGAVSTRDPHRDRLIVKTLLTGEAAWIIFPEGRMVKNKKLIEKGRYMISYAGGKHPPHTGAATLAMRTEFYRQRLRQMELSAPDEAKRLVKMFNLSSLEAVSNKSTYLVPVNLTYYPVRAKENILSRMASALVDNISQRFLEEIMTEGSMLLSGVDIDIRFGQPIRVDQSVRSRPIYRDIRSRRSFDFDDPIPSVGRMRKEALKLMQRYMAAIYGMTTVNHDHLFASTLKKMPLTLIEEANLRRRVYLAATTKLTKTPVWRHQSLETDQVHLLTDDRYHKYQDFISLAINKGIVKKIDGVLIKDASKLATIFDFHRARIDNPIAVIANEVEPLISLQHQISWLCWQPAFWLKRKIARSLLRKALEDFELDYETFFSEGESKPKSVGRPFLIKGRSKAIGIVLSHGYMAAPLEVKSLAAYLGRKGYWVYVPRLKGHGTSPEDLAQVSYQDWINSMDEGYAIMANICRRIVAGGFSTGAALALDLAARVKPVAGVFAVSTPLRLQYFSSHLVPAMDMWNRLMEKVRLDEAKKEFVENNPENPHINYLRNPISGVRELERLMDAVEPKLPSIKAPALVVQSAEDPVVDPKGSERVFKLIGSEDKQYVLFNFNRHGILLGDGSDRVHRAIGDFIDHLT
jgi:esterase/lipase/1-acyl-sn-glycerol-3-phosphate acyltransferase